MLTTEQVEKISALATKYPNNMDLGKNARSNFIDKDFVRSTPNDMDLGKKLRSIVLEKISKEATR